MPFKNAIEYIKDEEQLSQLPVMALPLKQHGKLCAFELSGHEMLFDNRGIASGDIIVARLFDKKLLKAVHKSILFVVVCADGIFVRRLFAIEKQVIFACDNEHYAPLSLKASEILELWEVKTVISANLQSPSNFEQRLELIENKIKKS